MMASVQVARLLHDFETLYKDNKDSLYKEPQTIVGLHCKGEQLKEIKALMYIQDLSVYLDDVKDKVWTE